MSLPKFVRLKQSDVNQLFRIASLLLNLEAKIRSLLPGHGEAGRVCRELRRVVSELYTLVSGMRLVPIRNVLNYAERVAYDTASKLGKEIKVETRGHDIRIDRLMAEILPEALLHIVRNAVDHGIEPPEERVASGKPRYGTIKIIAEQEGNYIAVSVEDDGRGIDVETVKRRAVELGIVKSDEVDKLTWSDIVRILTTPGFSTKKRASLVSGRGVGLDVVRSIVEKLGGDLIIQSERGKGTVVKLRVPYHAAAIKALLARIDGTSTCIAVPIDGVEQVVPFSMIEKVPSGGYVFRGHSVKILAFGTEGDLIVLIGRGNEKRSLIGLIVRDVIGYESIIVYPLPKALRGGAVLFSGVGLFKDEVCFLLDIGKVG